MQYQDKIKRTISQFIYSQLPTTVHLDFDKPITSDRSLFTRFLEVYYEFLERGLITTIADKKDDSIGLLQDDMIGKTIGESVPELHGELMRLPSYRDIDLTKESLTHYLYNEHLNNYTTDTLGDKSRLLKLASMINRSKGTRLSYEILFRFIFIPVDGLNGFGYISIILKSLATSN